jgi:hypothetical protein
MAVRLAEEDRARRSSFLSRGQRRGLPSAGDDSGYVGGTISNAFAAESDGLGELRWSEFSKAPSRRAAERHDAVDLTIEQEFSSNLRHELFLEVLRPLTRPYRFSFRHVSSPSALKD